MDTGGLYYLSQLSGIDLSRTTIKKNILLFQQLTKVPYDRYKRM